MRQEEFILDLQKIYDELQKRQVELGAWMGILHNKKNDEAQEHIDNFLKLLNLPKTSETTMALLNRLINLREDALEQVMLKQNFSQEQIINAKEQAYFFVSDFYMRRFERLRIWIEEEELLNPFYRTLLAGVHSIGQSITRWQNGWTSHIINGINQELFRLFDGDEEKIFEMLREKRLLDYHNGKEADRCYSVLVANTGGYNRVSYAQAFKKEIEELDLAFEVVIDALKSFDDDVFGQKEEWLEYFKRLHQAFLHTNPDELVAYWSEVDRAWMKIKTPLQVGHPLEYYEDHYRKAVALEWDLRIVNPRLSSEIKVPKQIRAFASKIAITLGVEAEQIFAKNFDQINRTQLYIGRPLLYYGAEFNGLFSAQVVPNDEKVSQDLGKKIFAYGDFVYQSQKDKPIMALAIESFGKDFVLHRRSLLDNYKRWMRLYEISTIGHEYGHILWIDDDTEIVMNHRGQFKNIEEFKATTGGLMAFFEFEDEELKIDLMEEIIARAIGLISWMEVGEVLPYYCEGLIHLEILYRNRAISFDGIRVLIDYKAYEEMKNGYISAYKELAKHYVNKQDAMEFLECYAKKDGEYFLPITPAVKNFVKEYYRRYQVIGQQVALL